MSLLLELGATRHLANERGQTPMGYAKFLGMHAVIAILEPNEGVRKVAVMKAQRAAGDAAAKAEQEQRRDQELQARGLCLLGMALLTRTRNSRVLGTHAFLVRRMLLLRSCRRARPPPRVDSTRKQRERPRRRGAAAWGAEARAKSCVGARQRVPALPTRRCTRRR